VLMSLFAYDVCFRDERELRCWPLPDVEVSLLVSAVRLTRSDDDRTIYRLVPGA
jgi:hypothetical protein